jgi:hypothetical protein
MRLRANKIWTAHKHESPSAKGSGTRVAHRPNKLSAAPAEATIRVRMIAVSGCGCARGASLLAQWRVPLSCHQGIRWQSTNLYLR